MFLEKRNWGTYITPLNCVSIPCGFVTVLAIIYPYFSSDFPHFYMPALVVWMVGLLAFELPSLCLSRLVQKKRTFKSGYTSISGKFYQYICFISFLIIAVLFLRMRSVSGAGSWGSDDYSEEFSANSLIGHLSVIIIVILSIMIYQSDKKHKAAILMSLLCLVCLYAMGVKSWIICPIFIGLFARISTGKTQLTLKLIIISVSGCIAVFGLSYILLMVVTGQSEMNSDFWRFLGDHFMYYLIGGPLAFSIDYRMNIIEPDMTESLFSPLVNIYRLFSGEPYVNPINMVGIPIGHSFNNVRTFFGTLYAYSHSWWGMISITLLFSCMFYVVQLFSIRSNNPFLLLANCTNLSLLVLGFFEFYWLNLTPYEVLFLFLFLSFIYHYLPKECNYLLKKNS